MKKLACSTAVRPTARSGFTLIELMIVVAILGVLASIAIPVFRTAVLRSKTGEATANLSVMFKGTAAYYNGERATQGQDGVIKLGCTIGDVGPVPTDPNAGKQKFVAVPEFRAIGFNIADYVYFSYGLFSATVNDTCEGAANSAEVYTLYANGDLDGDNATSNFELAVGSDADNQLYHSRGLYIENELE
jgi:prepilin-type N-terminal cleavage/methylation domain-containing protein